MISLIGITNVTARCSKISLYLLVLIALSSSFNHLVVNSAKLVKEKALDDADSRDIDAGALLQGSTITTTTASATSVTAESRITNSDANNETATTIQFDSVLGATIRDTTAISSITEDKTTEQLDELSNTTLPIDYDRQGYGTATTSKAPLTIAISNEPISVIPTVTDTFIREAGEQSNDDDELKDTDNGIGSTKSIRATAASLRSKPDIIGDRRYARFDDKDASNASNIYVTLLRKKPYSHFWTVEQKWDDIFKRFMAVQGAARNLMMKSFFRDIEYYADISISPKCADDLRFIQDYVKKSKNFRWLAHMFDSFGKAEPGMLTGNMAELGHVIQCIKVRAPAKPSNHSFEERYFELQTDLLGERFRGKYCLASIRPVLPERPKLVSRFGEFLNVDLLSNISYMGEPNEIIKQRMNQASVPSSVAASIDRLHYRLDQVPFESELFQYLIEQRNFMFSLPRFMGVCYPSSCSEDDIRYSLQKTVDAQHQVVDMEFKCEVEEYNTWDWFSTPRLIIYVFLFLVISVVLFASITRNILVDRLQLRRRKNLNANLVNLMDTVDLLSLDKCVGVLFVKTKQASSITDLSKPENNRSTSIDALKGLLTLILIYSQLVQLGCLPVPFMWSKWSDAMFPFYRSWITQAFINTTIWTEAFYIISAYLIGLKLLENNRPRVGTTKMMANQRLPDLASFALKRYVRLSLPMLAFIVLNYVWPRLSNGFVMQDQADKLLAPCDNHGWANLLMFHNYNQLSDTCLWPSHVSASFFQLHLLSYPILILLLVSLQHDNHYRQSNQDRSRLLGTITFALAASLMLILATFGVIYPAYLASDQELIVPFLIDYLDFDNYQRVIELVVMPTYNHLTSYMLGIALAYLVVRRRAKRELRKPSGTDSIGHCWNLDRENSLESINYSSTQRLDFGPVAFKGAVEMLKLKQPQTDIYSMDLFNQEGSAKGDEQRAGDLSRYITGALTTTLICTLILIASTASWFWNGLGQPMNGTQTFWYMCATKTAFNLLFACLFYKHFATRRNSTDSWIIIRFLVPIGRMSLMVFYMSWLVIWFDLLSSPYQWHPSHYFVFEKFNEIIFITLVVSLFAYGMFEGTVKILYYMSRKADLQKSSAGGVPMLANNQGFDFLFSPLHCHLEESEREIGNLAASYQEQSASTAKLGENETVDKSSTIVRQLANSNPSSRSKLTKASAKTNPSMASRDFDNDQSNKSYVVTSSIGGRNPSRTVSQGNTGRHLSIADQYKLNAELRANYSFASIGLYESAGAIGDLPSSSDPQVSPEPSSRHRR